MSYRIRLGSVTAEVSRGKWRSADALFAQICASLADGLPYNGYVPDWDHYLAQEVAKRLGAEVLTPPKPAKRVPGATD